MVRITLSGSPQPAWNLERGGKKVGTTKVRRTQLSCVVENLYVCSILSMTLKSTKKKRSFEASSSGGNTVVGGG